MVCVFVLDYHLSDRQQTSFRGILQTGKSVKETGNVHNVSNSTQLLMTLSVIKIML